MTKENQVFLDKYLEEAKESTSIGEHLFALNVILEALLTTIDSKN